MRALALTLVSLAALSACSPNESPNSSAVAATSETTTAPPSSPPKLPEGTLNGPTLISYAQYRLTYVPPDQYTKLPTDSVLAGRHFAVEIRKTADGKPLYTSYDADRETLFLSVNPNELDDEGISDRWYNYVVVYQSTDDQPSVKMANAYGVEKNVTFTKVSQIGLGGKGGRIGVFKPESLGILSNLTKSIHMSPDKARETFNLFSVVFEGTIVPDKNGRTINCPHQTEQPAIDNTYPTDTTACVVNAKISRVAVLGRSGEILAEWGAHHQ